ncbi:MAG: hypothetical protein KC442_06815 [Thermomicrobiales bacterium]|nr:hypothetical protein [Thermomicrobiales bacterium]
MASQLAAHAERKGSQNVMDEQQFDLLTKTVGSAPNRRHALRLLTGAAGGGLAALLGVLEHEAGEAGKRKKAGRKNRKQKRKQGRKREHKRDLKHGRRQDRRQDRQPQSPPPELCTGGTKLCDGACIPDSECCANADCPGSQVCRDGACGAPPLYPNLRTLPVEDLAFDEHPDNAEVHILRFSNTVWNAGEGRLELESDVDSTDMPKPIYQNLYDAPVGGKQVERKRIASDFIYHPYHNHFHFADFAEYLLLGKNANGEYRPMMTEGTKTSFCIMDTLRQSGDYPSQYETCNADLQGLTPGWADTYGSLLWDQWIILGDQPLPDGEYAVQSTADPKGLLDEGGGAREKDNVATTYFTVDGGVLRDERQEP